MALDLETENLPYWRVKQVTEEQKALEKVRENRKRRFHYAVVSFVIFFSTICISVGFRNVRVCTRQSKVPLLLIVAGFVPFIERFCVLAAKARRKLAIRQVPLRPFQEREELGERDRILSEKMWDDIGGISPYLQCFHFFCLFFGCLTTWVTPVDGPCSPYVPIFLYAYTSFSFIFLITVFIVSRFIQCKIKKYDLMYN